LKDVVDALQLPLLTFYGSEMTVSEVAGFGTGLVCVWLAAQKNVWNFPFGIANSALLLLLFLDARLFADSSLQLVFIALNVRGWWQWVRGVEREEEPVTTASRRQLGHFTLYGIGLSVALGIVLWHARGSLPVFDGLITGYSLLAQWLLNRKVLENWLYWMAVDVVSIPVYAYKGLYLIAFLYFVFLLLCVQGYQVWRRQVAGTFLQARPAAA
jgi:nicotinamide mononucleotide transporter